MTPRRLGRAASPRRPARDRAALAAAVATLLLARYLAGGAGGAALAAPSGRKAGSPLLGSPGFRPSPESPIGWRGDGTGRYPGATPPIRWARLAKTPVRRFRCTARRPAKGGPSGSPVVERAGKFLATEWLVLGPLDPPDAAKPLDGEAIPGEAALEPDQGERAGGLEWKRVERAGGVDFGEAFGAKPKRKVAYALVYFWSEAECRAGMGWGGRDLRQWLNGGPASGWEGARHAIRKGWNRLLVKSVSPSNDDAWRFGCHFFPRSDEGRAGLEYEETNIHWTTALPAKSWAVPVIVGDRLFTTSEPNDLVCVAKDTGKMLWVRSNPVWYAAVEVEKAKPARLAYARVTGSTLTLIANRPLDRASATSARSYAIPRARIAKAELSPDARTVRLTARGRWPWKYGDTVTVSLSGLRAADGEEVKSDLAFTVLPGRPVGGELLKEFLVGEVRTNVNPAEVLNAPLIDEKAPEREGPAEGATWKRVRSDGGVFDLMEIVGEKQNAAAHACAYLYSDAEREVELWLGSDDGVRAVVNGEAVHVHAVGRGCTVDEDKVKGVKLRKGWNTLLLVISQGGGGWAFAARVMDASGRKPAEGVSCTATRPDRARSGLDAEAETGPVADEPGGFGYLDDLRPKTEELAGLNDRLVTAMQRDGNDFWSSDENRRMDERRRKLAWSLTSEIRKADRKYRIGIGWGGGNCATTPVTDGRHVFAWFGDTGVMTCYGLAGDLEGERVWTRFEKPGGGEHGINSSPVLVRTPDADLLIVIAGGKWVAFEKETGRVVWRRKYRHPSYGTPVVARVGDDAVLVGPDGQVVRARDGAEVSKSIGRFDGECASAVLEGRRFHLFARAGYCAAELPERAEEGAGGRIVRKIEPKVLDPAREPYPVGSPVFHDGVLFALRSGWGAGGRDVVLYPFTVASAEPIYRRVLELTPEIYYGPEGGGVQASLTYAGGSAARNAPRGGHIYVIDNRGTALVFEAGRECRQVARNPLEHWIRDGRREVTGGTPVFEGRYMYLRESEMLYCIGGE